MTALLQHSDPRRDGKGTRAHPLTPTVVREAVDRATRRIAPVWPLKSFVAVNPFLGLADRPFEQAARTVAKVAGARMTAPRSFYAEAIRAGRITDQDLAAAVAARPGTTGGPTTASELRAWAARGDQHAPAAIAPTVADVAEATTGTRWNPFIAETIAAWAASYFDEGQAIWSSPWRDLAPYAAWRAEAELDRSPEVAGLKGFRAVVRSLPETPTELVQVALLRLDVPAQGLETYLHRLLSTVSGWAAYAAYQRWEAELHGGKDDAPVDLLAIRLAYELGLMEAFGDEKLADAWDRKRGELADSSLGAVAEAELEGDLMLQHAFDLAIQRELLEPLKQPRTPRASPKASVRPKAQAAFCIDVRSEVFRRALEAADQEVETIGFAGFFGFPIEYVRLGEGRGGKQCPVLLTPQFRIAEHADVEGPQADHDIAEKRDLRRLAAAAWRSFKMSAVSCFGFVGPVGLAYAKKLVTDSLGTTRPVEHPDHFGLDHAVAHRCGPSLEPKSAPGGDLGMTAEQRLEVATGVLKAMSMTTGFARLVLLAGHGSTTVNNPHATGLDCGACGGHTGEANARVAAAVLNDPDVRIGLRERGIDLPDDTIFLAGQHDTTTDEVTIFDRDEVPGSHAEELAWLEEQLAEAGRKTRRERSAALGLTGRSSVDQAVSARSRDWSQVRPEWGLAGCAAFVAAPRSRTQGLDLRGRSFLHSYEWQQDDGFGVLELIMTAPMVVASWISLQYYGSTVDNRAFGSGNKTLHNVVGTLGVLEGTGGDLRTGLPWQSVHDGEKYVHEPARLNVVIEAPTDAMNDVLKKHPAVQQLLDHGWLNLFALNDEGVLTHRYAGELTWQEV